MIKSRQNTDFYGNPINMDTEGNQFDVLPDGTVDYTGSFKDPNMPSLQGRKAYEQKVASMQEPEQVAGVKSEGSGAAKGAMATGQSIAQGGNAMDAASSGLMMSGNPYAMAAGLGLQTISTINKNKQQREQNRYLAEVERVKARQDAIDRLAQIGQNLRA